MTSRRIVSDKETFLDRGDEKRTSDSSNIAPAVPSLVHVHKLYQPLLTPAIDLLYSNC